MNVGDRGVLRCSVCADLRPHEVIPSVQRGQVFVRCLACGTVTHQPKPVEVRPS